ASVRAPRPRSLSNTPLRRDCRLSNNLPITPNTYSNGLCPRGRNALPGGDPSRRAGDRKSEAFPEKCAGFRLPAQPCQTPGLLKKTKASASNIATDGTHGWVGISPPIGVHHD